MLWVIIIGCLYIVLFILEFWVLRLVGSWEMKFGCSFRNEDVC